MAESRTLSYQPRPTRRWRDEAAAEWHRFAARFTRENIISNLKTLAWVVPLTLLIWIYAEREQVASMKDVSVPFELASVDPNVSVSLSRAQDKNLLLELQGPQARLQDVLTALQRGLKPQELRIEVPPSLEKNRIHGLDVLSLVRNQKIFMDNGVTVLSCQPARLDVMVDAVVEREAKIVRPPGAKNVDATFDPPTVKVRGPLSLLNRVEQENGGQILVWADLRDEMARAPGHIDKDVALRRPGDLEDERVTVNGPTTVHASIDVRQADKTLHIRSLPITVDSTDGLLDKYKIEWLRPNQPVLQNITVTGPPEIIDAMDRPEFEPKAKARLVLTPQDVGERHSKVVKYDLPDPVHIIDDDKNRTVEFRLVDKSTLPPP